MGREKTEPAQKHHVEAFLGDGLREKMFDIYEQIERGKIWNFSWAAAFWSFFWFFHKKMYAAGFFVLVLFQTFDWSLAAILLPLGIPKLAQMVVHIVIMVLLVGFLAPYLHYHWVHWRVNGLVSRYGQDMSEEDLLELLRRKGGTNLKGVLYVVGVLSLLVLALFIYLWMTNPEGLGQALKSSFMLMGN